MTDLPTFKYHPNPQRTGMIVQSEAECPCCNRARGYVYASEPYAVEEVENICPWCIADGSAAEKYDAEFSDPDPLMSAGLPQDVVDEVTRRTPGFITWQQDVWLTCCGDACEFHGDISREELLSLPQETFSRMKTDLELDDNFLAILVEHYERGGSHAIYKFKCRHCGNVRLWMDST